MKKARVENGIVVETLAADPFPDFHPSLVWVECSNEVTAGWLFDGNGFFAYEHSAEQIESDRIAKIDQQILALEKQAIEQGLIRTIIDDLMIRSLAIAAQSGVTEAQLLDPESEHYSRAYAKVHANAAARAVLRAQR